MGESGAARKGVQSLFQAQLHHFQVESCLCSTGPLLNWNTGTEMSAALWLCASNETVAIMLSVGAGLQALAIIFINVQTFQLQRHTQPELIEFTPALQQKLAGPIFGGSENWATVDVQAGSR